MAAKKQGYKSRQDESLGARRGARKSLKRNVSAAGRRAMASGPQQEFDLSDAELIGGLQMFSALFAIQSLGWCVEDEEEDDEDYEEEEEDEEPEF